VQPIDHSPNQSHDSESVSEVEAMQKCLDVFVDLRKKHCCSKHCLMKFSFEDFYNFRKGMEGLDRRERYFVLCGYCCGQARGKYTFMGVPMCVRAVASVFGFDYNRISQKTYEIHTTKSITPYTTFSHGKEVGENVASALDAFFEHLKKDLAEARVGYHKFKYEVYLLPSFWSDKDLFAYYEEFSMKHFNAGPCSYSYFKKIWNGKFKGLIIAKSKSDVCSTCKMIDLLKEDERIEVVREVQNLLEEHTQLYRAAREHYNRSCSNEDSVIICYDKAEALRLPMQLDKDGQLFFKTGRKCDIFGICELKEDPLQHNFLIDESEFVSGADAIVSYVFHWIRKLEKPRPKKLLVWADNTVSQNKNKVTICFFAMLAFIGCFSSIEFNFLEQGHTKFANVIKSIPSNESVVVDEKFRCFQWTQFFQDLKTIPNITSYSSFEIDGNWNVKFRKNFCEKKFASLNLNPRRTFVVNPNIMESPQLYEGLLVKAPLGLSEERKQQIFDQLRDHYPAKKALQPYCAPDPKIVHESSNSNAETEAETKTKSEVEAEVTRKLKELRAKLKGRKGDPLVHPKAKRRKFDKK
jgi:hypothetical protein